MFEDSFRRPSETFLARAEEIGETVVRCHAAVPGAGLNDGPE